MINIANYITKIDDASSTVTYFGKAVRGSSTSSAVWQIYRISVGGTVTSFEWADGDDSFTKVWDNRASYSYG